MNFNGMLTGLLLQRNLNGMLAMMTLTFGLVAASKAENAGSSVFSQPPLNDAAIILPVEEKTLTLRNALKLALQHNPELASFAKEALALQGLTIQAGLLPNPVIQFDSEDISSRSNGPAARFESIRISQLFETGGKRPARKRAALFGQESAEQDYMARQLDLIATVANVFLDVLAGQERIRLALAGQELAQKVVDAAAKRVKAGKAPPIEETRASIALATADIEVKQAQRSLASFRKQLALLWGNPKPFYESVLGDLETFITIPDFQSLEIRIQQNPLALRSLKNLEQRQALLTLEKARRIPDVTVTAGMRRYGHDIPNDTTALVSLSIPLPLFDRNQGNLMAAQQRMNRAIDEQAAIDLQLRALLTQAYESLVAADTEISMLRDEILPGARETFRMASRGYALGRFGFLELLDAQRTLFQNQTLYLQALTNYQRLINEIERLIAEPIENISKPKK
ncbi:MAG TPA: TolC family protein [Nitrosomonas nitrosa]|uniref:TolC family protein n=1 Tax=Nitrosomonas sp. TaxID=42353 RepID=UPI00208A3AFF|nr:TolC family protein [Nitrosomonas sp.]GJL74158.1 MAG: RND transporter [Nitrosomonas sp.]HNP52729.1 TolC family protein [Nitrosomonas nitrosa]